MGELHLPTVAPEVLFYLKNIPITNTMVNAWLAIVIFLIFGLILKSRIKMRPGNLQNWSEFFLEKLLGYFDQVTGERKKTIRFLPLVGSIFFFILLSNWLGLMPGTGSLTINHYPVFRPANTDLNLTLVMALTAVIASHLFGLVTVGVFTHLNKFIQIGTFFKSLKKGPIAIFTAIIELAVGLLEIISEFAKVVSLSLRLFGNIFAGEILITVMYSLVVFLVPTPFMMLELLVGIIQAAVFAMLSLVYLTVMTTKPQAEAH